MEARYRTILVLYSPHWGVSKLCPVRFDLVTFVPLPELVYSFVVVECHQHALRRQSEPGGFGFGDFCQVTILKGGNDDCHTGLAYVMPFPTPEAPYSHECISRCTVAMLVNDVSTMALMFRSSSAIAVSAAVAFANSAAACSNSWIARAR